MQISPSARHRPPRVYFVEEEFCSLIPLPGRNDRVVLCIRQENNNLWPEDVNNRVVAKVTFLKKLLLIYNRLAVTESTFATALIFFFSTVVQMSLYALTAILAEQTKESTSHNLLGSYHFYANVFDISHLLSLLPHAMLPYQC